MKVSTARLAGAAALSLLLAAAPAHAAAPAGRYTAAGGVVKDSKTGLYWQQVAAPTTYSFASAMTYCSGNAAALSGTGWRLPAIKELQTLVDYSVNAPTIDVGWFPSTPSGYFWSSTLEPPVAPYNAWGVNFASGTTNGLDLASFMANVRCVR